MSHRKGNMTIEVKQGNKIRYVNADDVIFIESMGRKAVMHLRGETLEYYAVLHRLEEQLGPAFFRVHRAYLVNLHYVAGCTKKEVQMADGSSLLISKYRLAEFQNVLASHKKQPQD